MVPSRWHPGVQGHVTCGPTLVAGTGILSTPDSGTTGPSVPSLQSDCSCWPHFTPSGPFICWHPVLTALTHVESEITWKDT